MAYAKSWYVSYFEYLTLELMRGFVLTFSGQDRVLKNRLDVLDSSRTRKIDVSQDISPFVKSPLGPRSCFLVMETDQSQKRSRETTTN